MKTTIIRNNRKGYGFEYEELRCYRCYGKTTRYIQIENNLICRSCLTDLDRLLGEDLLNELVVDTK